jgi:hypothetical protein
MALIDDLYAGGGAVGGILLGVIIAWWFFKPATPDADGVGFWMNVRITANKWIYHWFNEAILFMPNALVLFGFIVDIIAQEFRYSIASIIGISSVLANSAIANIIGRFAGISILVPKLTSGANASFGCHVPGFEILESTFSPQAIVLPTAIFTYLLIDFGLSRGVSSNIGLGVIAPAIIIIQAVMMFYNNCLVNYYFTNPIWTVLLAILVGGLFGGLSWITVWQVAPSRLPSAGATGAGAVASPLGKNAGAASAGAGATCSAPNDEDQLVCEMVA